MFTQGTRELVHRWVVQRYFNITLPKHLVVDHINGDKLDNRRENLQLISQSLNRLRGKSGQHYSKSNYRRIGWNKQSQGWRVSLSVDGKVEHFGEYFVEETAAVVADMFAIRLLSPQTALNFPELRNPAELKERLKSLGFSI